MKKGLTFLFGLILCIQVFAADNIFTGATSNLWGTNTNWSLGVVPTANDGNVARFNATSPACTINTSTRVCNNIDFTGYTNTITFSTTLTVSGNITLGTGMSFAGSGNFVCNLTGTLTSNGVTMPQPFFFQGTSIVYTLADDWTFSSLLTCNGTTGTTINGVGKTLICNAGFTVSTVATVSGTAGMRIAGGIWTSTLSTNVLRLNVELAGNVTLATNVAYNTGTLTYTSGAITVAGNTFTCAAATTFNTNGMSFNNLTLTFAGTYTLTSNMDVNGTLQIGTSTSTQTLNGFQITASAGINLGAMSSGVINGTTAIVMDGTGTITPPTSTGQIRNPFTINTAGAITFGTTNSATVRFQNGSFTYTAGTINSSGSTIVFGSQGATQDNSFTSATDINSSAGQTIWTYKGTLNNATNWRVLPSQPPTISSGSSN